MKTKAPMKIFGELCSKCKSSKFSNTVAVFLVEFMQRIMKLKVKKDMVCVSRYKFKQLCCYFSTPHSSARMFKNVCFGGS